MAEIKNGLLVEGSRVFIPSTNINVFPCSRRGQYSDSSANHYDPEARLNTERTNRLHTATNGFKDSFITSFVKDKDENGTELETGTLIFTLAGYYVEVKSFSPAAVIDAPEASDTIYAHLRLRTDVSLGVSDYLTEILDRQTSAANDKNYLDVLYTYSSTDTDGKETTAETDFFVGISFTKEHIDAINPAVQTVRHLPLFSYSGSNWELVQTSLLPRVEHGETVDSITIKGDLTVDNGDFTVEYPITNADGEITGTKTSVNIAEASVTVNVPAAINNTLAVTRPDGSTEVAATITGGLTVCTGDATITEGTLTVSAGDTTLQVLDAGATTLDSLIVNNDVLTVDDGVTIVGETQITGNLTISATDGQVVTPKLDVDTIISDAADGLVITPKTKINDTLEVTGKATLSDELAVTKKTALQDTLEVTGDTIIKSNLTVEDNINVGTPTTPATADNGGYIVAKKDITAEQDLIAKRDIEATEKATVKSLVVGERADIDSTDAGTITAKNLVKAPTLEVSNELKVQSGNTSSPAEANMDKANIISATITSALTVHNDTDNKAKITADRVQIDKDLTVYDTITATKTFSDTTKNNLNVNKASITTLSSTTVTADTVNSDDLNQKIDSAYYDVPVIFVQQLNSTESNEYQLQIVRANVLPYKAN